MAKSPSEVLKKTKSKDDDNKKDKDTKKTKGNAMLSWIASKKK